MKQNKYSFEQFEILIYLVKWSAYIIPVSVTVGSLVALFLFLLDRATQVRWEHQWLLYLLPLAGIAITVTYSLYGKNSEAGNNLIIDEIHKPGGGIPTRMTPFILISTVITHLFGGSAGREGTAVQMGGSISSLFARWYGIRSEDKRILLLTGMAAGFGAVFGTPVTGAIFALEVLTIGRIKYDALIPCLIASFVADITCSAWGIYHTHYAIAYRGEKNSMIPFINFNVILLLKVIVAGVAFGIVGYLFAETTHFIKDTTKKYISAKWLIPVAGGVTIIVFTYILGTDDYLGLGVNARTKDGVSIVSAFHPGGAAYLSWLWKLLFTAVTLGTGFKGGEVTPLFFIGATLGNIIATLSNAPIDLFAGIGFIAVFAGATNTPLACTMMGVELFGGENLLYYAVACFTAYYFSGHSGIYTSQRVAVSKFHISHTEEETIKQIKERNNQNGYSDQNTENR
jgi:H+/Cl- antiporter ClcA